MPSRNSETGTPEAVDAYIAALPDAQRDVLERIRETIRSAAPGAIEVISYQMPAFRFEGRMLVWYAGFKDHCSLFPASEMVMAEQGAALEPYASGRGTLRFTVDHPIPAALVRKIVKTRIRENAAGRTA